MPVAVAPDTAARWATERAIDLWIVVADGLGPGHAETLGGELQAVVADGALVAFASRDGTVPASLAAVTSTHSAVPDGGPSAISRLAWASGATDIRRAGIIASEAGWIEAGLRAGLGAVVAIATTRDAAAALTWSQPDVILEPERLAEVDAERWGSRRRHRERILLNPGPTVVTDRVHRAVGGPDLCHREPEYGEIAADVRRLLLRSAGAPTGWEAVLIGGGGTSAMEAMVNGTVRPGHRLLVVRNGTYGDRLATMADRAGIDHVDLSWSTTEPASPVAIAAALDADPSIDAVAVVHHETTTGLLNPVAEIAVVCRERGRLLAVDAISSLGAEELDLVAGGIDLVAGTANKCLHGLPGVSFVLLSPAGVERVGMATPRTLYLDLAVYLAAAARGTVPFTPPIPAVYALRAALEELLDEGPDARRSFYRARMAWLDAALDRLGLDIVVRPGSRSSSIRAIRLPRGVSYETVHDRLRDRGFVIYAGMGPAAAEQFRICVLGAIGLRALADLEPAIADAISVAD